MSTLAWVRLQTELPRNHKIIALTGMKDGHRAAFVYICGLTHAGEQGTDGFIAAPVLPMIHGRKVDADKLVEVGLWKPRPGGYEIHDWAEYQQVNDETKKRTERARAAAASRWAKVKTAPDVMPEAMQDAMQNAMHDALPDALPNAMQRRGEERRGLRGEGGHLSGERSTYVTRASEGAF